MPAKKAEAKAEPAKADGYVMLKAPFTKAETLVPAELIESLLDSGYTK